MVLGRFTRFFGALLFLAVLTVPVANAAPNTTPAVLTTVTAADTSAAETQVTLTFAPAAQTFSIIRDGTDKPAIAFALSSRAPTLRTPTTLKGLVRAVSFEQQDTILIVKLSTSAPARLTAAPSGDKQISLTVTSVNASRTASSATEASAPQGPLPKATIRGPADDNFVIVPLKYADVSEVVGLLAEGQTVKPNNHFVPKEPAFGSAGVNGATYAPSQTQSDAASDEPLAQSVNDVIAIDRRLNAIILHGPPQVIENLKAKIALIDVPVPSVILETVFVELSETGAHNLGLDFANASGQLAVSTFQTGGFVPFGQDRNELASAQMQAAIYAQVQQGEGRVVSKPRISSQSGASAKIITGDALPILTAIQLSGVNGVSQQVQYVNVGVTLQIAPRVSDDGFVTSHVFCVVSSVTGFSQGYPTISQREAQTSATVRDGETFVIGGLTQENRIQSDTHVPFLGRIPIIGDLFFNVDKGSDTKTELYIVVTPHIIKQGETVPTLPSEVHINNKQLSGEN